MAGETSSEHKQEVRWESRVQAKVLLRGDGENERRGEGEGARPLGGGIDLGSRVEET